MQDIYKKINIGIVLSTITILLSVAIMRWGADAIYCLYTVLVLVSFSYLSENTLNMICIKNGIKRYYINKKKTEEANKDLEKRLKKEKEIL